MDNDLQAFKNWRNQAVGKAFQETIETLAGYTPGVLLMPQWPQVQFFKGGKAKVVGEAWPDYLMFHYNRPFMFDAKTTVEEKTYRPPTSEKHQFEKMVLAASHGIAAFYLVNWLKAEIVEIFMVHETDTWPVKYRFTNGAWASYTQDENWLEKMVNQFCKDYYR